MATAASFAATPRCASGLVSTANTNTDGTTALTARTLIFAAGANGSRLDSAKIKGIVAEGTQQVADTVRLWLYDGSTMHFFSEQLIPAGSGVVSATVPNVEYTLPIGIVLANGWSLYASTKIGGTTASYHVSAFGGDF